MIVILIIGILIAIAVPNWITARENSRRNACIENLKKLDYAKEQYAMENKLPGGAFVAMGSLTGPNGYLKGGVSGPLCPGGGTYTVNPVGTDPICSLSAGPAFHFIP